MNVELRMKIMKHIRASEDSQGFHETCVGVDVESSLFLYLTCAYVYGCVYVKFHIYVKCLRRGLTFQRTVISSLDILEIS